MGDGTLRQKEWFELLLNAIDTPIYTTRNRRVGNQFKPTKQYRIGGVIPPIDHRTVGSNEVVIELDAKSYAQNLKYALRIKDYLDSHEIPYYTFWSGNKSVHIHIFLDLEITSQEAIDYVGKAIDDGCNIFQEIRMWLVNEIVTQSGFSKSIIGEGNIVDVAKLKWNDITGKATLIRCCGGANPKVDAIDNSVTYAWKNFYQELPKTKPNVESFDDVEYPKEIFRYKVPEGQIVELAQNYQKRLTYKHKQQACSIPYDGKFLGTPCCQQIQEGMKQGRRAAGAKVLAIACRMDGMGINDAKAVLVRYVNSCSQLPNEFHVEEAFQWLEWVYNQVKPYWTCKHSKDLRVCDAKDCPYNQKRYSKVLDIIENENPLRLIKSALDTTVVGEDSLKLQLFLLFLTKEFNPEWCILLDGPAASGKTHTMKRVAELFGDEGEDYFVYSRFTQSSLNHMEELAKKWNNSIVIIEELQGAKNVVEQLRVAISEGKLTLLETTEVLKNGVKAHETKSKEIDLSNALFVTCNAEGFDQGEQLKSRAWILNTSQGGRQTKSIVDYYLTEFGDFAPTEVPYIEEIRAAIKFLEKPDRVVFPFAKELLQFIPTSTLRSRRDIKKIISLMKASAYFHQRNREWITTKGNKRVLIADWRDVIIVFGFAGESFNASMQGVGSKDLEYYDKIVNNLGSFMADFVIEDVMRWCGISYTGARKLMGNLIENGFFVNTTFVPQKARYEKTDLVPEYIDGVIDFARDKMITQDELLKTWIEEHTQ